jgi:hypothetical protein
MIISNHFAGFRLVRLLGEPGGFGQTYEAERDGERYALKVLHASLVDSVGQERFRREIEALQRPKSENLVDVADYGVDRSGGRDYHWIAMPFIEGRTLKQELEALGGVMPPARARLIARGIALGLAALHEAQIIHRDIKPANVLITVDGTVKLLDFGLARFLDYSTLTEPGMFMGTPAYASPEQLRGEPDLATDLYALGVVLYELLAGQRPFVHGDIAALIRAILEEPPEPPGAFRAGVPRELEAIVMRLLEKEALRRPATAMEVADELKLNIATAAPGADPYPRDDEPLVFARVGDADVDDAVNAVLRGDTPTGIVVGITERAALVPARKAARANGAHFAVDPFLLRMAFPNYARTRALRDLPYAPPGVSPWQPDDLRGLDASADLARKVIREQHHCGASLFMSAHFAVTSLDDAWVRRDAKLLDDSLLARDAFDSEKPLFSLMAASMDFLCSETAVLQFANRMRRGRPDGFWLLLDPLAPPGVETHVISALRLALLLQDLGVPVVLSRVGCLRQFFMACGVGGVEVGLGRYDGFRLSDWRSPPRQGGPGRIPPRFEFPSLLCSLPQDKAALVLRSGLSPESDCSCSACLLSSSVEDRLGRTTEHNAAVLAREREVLAGVPTADRIGRLRDAVNRAQALTRRLRRLSAWNDRMEHLRVFDAALDEVGRTGLLGPGRAARRAS